MFIILLGLIFIRPFISSLAFPYLNFAYSAFLLIFLALWFILRGVPLKENRYLEYPLLFFCLALIISVFFSQNKLNSLEELYKYAGGILIFLLAASLNYENKIRLLRIIACSGLAISLLAIYQYFFGFQHISDYLLKQGSANSFALDYISRKRVFFPFVTPNILAGFLIMNIALALSYKNNIRLIIPLSVALLLTKSLSALLSLFLALIIYFYLQGRLKKRTILFLFGLLLIAGVVFIVRSATQKPHIQPIFSLIMRFNYWKDTLKIIWGKPLTGLGIGNFNLAQSRYTHNSYLQIWAEIGILGIISFLWLLISVFRPALKNFKESASKKLIIGLITANAAFLIHNLFDFSFFLPEVSLIWWVILGLLKQTR